MIETTKQNPKDEHVVGFKHDRAKAFVFYAPSFIQRMQSWSMQLVYALYENMQSDFAHGRGFLWLAPLMALGVAIYFFLPQEPWISALSLFFIFAFFLTFTMHDKAHWQRVCIIIMVILCGVISAKIRTEQVKAPRLIKALYGVQLSGWIERIDQRENGVRRLWIKVAMIDSLPSEIIPRRVTITYRKPRAYLRKVGTGFGEKIGAKQRDQTYLRKVGTGFGEKIGAKQRDRDVDHINESLKHSNSQIIAGNYIKIRVTLLPPSEPVSPDATDFARMAYFQQRGANGYAIGPISVIHNGPAKPLWINYTSFIERTRNALAARIRNTIKAPESEIAAALIVGKREGIDETTKETLRQTGLAHLLAISGMHMALVTFTILLAIRSILAFSSRLALNYPIHKWAAFMAFFAAFGYLLLSGSSVSTKRAFIMVAITLIAVLFDRPAITLRSVALAAILILFLRPESLFEAGFQMSFMATVALIAVYERLRDWRLHHKQVETVGYIRSLWRVCYLYIGALCLTSLVAGIATAPYSLYHFNRIVPFGLLANLAAMPIFAFITMPSALLSVLALPFGIDSFFLHLLASSIDWILIIASSVEGLTKGPIFISSISDSALILISIGLLWLALWRARWRLLGFIPLVVVLILGPFKSRPDILVERDGKTIAVRSKTGKLQISGLRSGRFSTEKWLRADGDSRALSDPSLKESVYCDSYGCILKSQQGLTIAHSRHPYAFREDCIKADIIITPLKAPAQCQPRYGLIDKKNLETGGAHALYIQGPSFRKEDTIFKIKSPQTLYKIEHYWNIIVRPTRYKPTRLWQSHRSLASIKK